MRDGALPGYYVAPPEMGRGLFAKQDAAPALDGLSTLDTTGNENKLVVVNAAGDGFDLIDPIGGGDTYGSIEIDFGATPTDSATASEAVTGLLATDNVRAWFQGSDSTVDNTANDHAQAAVTISLVATPSTDSVSIDAFALHGLVTGKFNVRYSYA